MLPSVAALTSAKISSKSLAALRRLRFSDACRLYDLPLQSQLPLLNHATEGFANLGLGEDGRSMGVARLHEQQIRTDNQLQHVLKSGYIYAAVVALVVVLAFVSAISPQPGASSGETSSTVMSTSTTAFVSGRSTSGSGIAEVAVGIGGHEAAAYFNPATITVEIGVNNTVVWSNGDTAIHTVTSANTTASGLPLFNSGDMGLGAEFTYTFTKPGTYPYVCIYHGEMAGTVIVKA